jgi:hypothetical protein
MERPNFFILGAPKCGTSSLATWLSEHPNIFMSKDKEPNYFNTDGFQTTFNINDYERLFRHATRQHLAVGEASTMYLASKVAAKNILEFAPEARFIVMVRNPFEMAPSLHGELVFTGLEDEPDFERAWNLQETRRLGDNIPRYLRHNAKLLYGSCVILNGQRRDAMQLMYAERCRVGEQLARVLTLAPKGSVHVVFLEDIARDPRSEYLRILRFLELTDDGRQVFPTQNYSRRRRSAFIARAVNYCHLTKQRLGIRRRFGILEPTNTLNQHRYARPEISTEFKKRMQAEFLPDILLLESITSRDLRHWLVDAGNSDAENYRKPAPAWMKPEDIAASRF